MREKKYPAINMYETGQNIKKLMLLKKLTVKDIQDYLELSTPQSIYHWFDGRNLPTLDNLYALSELFHVSMDAIVKGNRRYELVSEEDRFYQRVYTYYEKLMMIKKAG